MLATNIINNTTLLNIQPNEAKLKTTKLLSLLNNSQNGLNKLELTKGLYNNFDDLSERQQDSIMTSVNKLIQRARKKINTYGYNLCFTKELGKFYLIKNNI